MFSPDSEKVLIDAAIDPAQAALLGVREAPTSTTCPNTPDGTAPTSCPP